MNEAADCVPHEAASARDRPMPRSAQIGIPKTRANTGAKCSAAGRDLQKRGEGTSITVRPKPDTTSITVRLKPDTTYKSG
jgi:hypothetical protein